MSWEKVKLGEISLCIQPGPFGSQLHNSDYADVGTPIVMPKDMVDGHIRHTGLIRVPEEYVARLQRHQVYEGNLMVARKGDVRRCVYITQNENGWLTGSDCLKVTLNGSCCFPKYIYYQLRSPFIGKWLEQISIGATMPSINTGLLSSIEIYLPPLDTQRRIADVLSAYDDLIENNRKQIKLLEEAAQRLYKEWFVDLRFPGHEHTKIVDGVPEGWKPCALDDVIEFDPKVRLGKDRVKQFVPMSALSTSSMVLDINEIIETKSNSGSKFQNGDTLLARITPCLENGKTAFVYGLESDEGAVGSTEYIVMRSKRLNPYMVYLLSRTSVFRQAAINSMSGSDGRQRVKADKLKALAYLLAPTGLIHIFERIASPMFEMIFELNKQIFATTEARDRLLPKMMSEEVEV